ncbi:hypothetical protein DFQ14_102205 [Halopolyspora algeriensis]|uniref:Uncharacterized protein n=1 Tax=Halopolyspora algeriensis TaxID=1500506 RepID=A0A368VUY2_9ACTN|nr:hypothetical protein [Halopolyspora algeriensis]RCW45904.1 hypothetical protein DFQ14_102205 [Halopolyspora algeriensis]TQM55318.1 hypothetical protein FHU43_0079 [Halopolyspora algeriensis]
MSAPEVGSSREHAWMAGAGESGWHAVAVSAGGSAPAAVCGYRLAGPVHRRLGQRPPQDGVREVCVSCTRAIGNGEHHRSFADTGCLPADPDIQWPTTDPDSTEGPTRRRPTLDAAMAVLLTPDVPEPRAVTVSAASAGAVARNVPRFVAEPGRPRTRSGRIPAGR